jgi:aflatoxin B1 aldehyde reductase
MSCIARESSTGSVSAITQRLFPFYSLISPGTQIICLRWEVAELVGICNLHGYIKPSVYQGLYNAIHRAVEPELLPCLRKFNIAFFAFNPRKDLLSLCLCCSHRSNFLVAGGFFTGRYSAIDASTEQGSRFDSDTWQGKVGRKPHVKHPSQRCCSGIPQAILERLVLQRHGSIQTSGREARTDLARDWCVQSLSMTALSELVLALRWMIHHSQLKREQGDAVIIGASSPSHIEQNLVDFEKGPLRKYAMGMSFSSVLMYPSQPKRSWRL